jgi:hypothetical protein
MEGAIRLAVALAVAAGEYDRATEILDLLRHAHPVRTVTLLERARQR